MGVVREASEDGYTLSDQDKSVFLNMDKAVFLKARFIEKNLDIAFLSFKCIALKCLSWLVHSGGAA